MMYAVEYNMYVIYFIENNTPIQQNILFCVKRSRYTKSENYIR